MLDKRAARFVSRAILVSIAWLPVISNGFTEPLSSEPPPITSIGKAHDLPPLRANGVPVHLLGTVTFYDPGDRELFLQDGTGGIYVNTDRPYPIRIGDLVDVVGKTDSSYRTEIAYGSSIRVVGRGPSYDAPVVSYSDLITGVSDSSLVRVRGRLRTANIEQHENSPSVHLDLVMPGGRAEIYLANSKRFNPQTLLDADVEITGVAGAQFDEKNQVTGAVLYARDLDSIRILKRPDLTVDRLPITDFDRVFQSRSVTDDSSRVRVRGAITYYQKGASVVLEANGKSIFVQTRQTNELKVGDVVDAYGFGSSSEYAPSLRDAFVVQTGVFQSIEPQAVSYDQAISALYSDNLVLLTGTLVSQMRRDRSDVLVVDVNGHLITAYIQKREEFVDLPLGSRVTVSGICRIDAGGPWRAPYGFHLDLRDHSDVHLLAYPSWWTVDHLIKLLSLITLIAIGTAAWASVLRKRNAKQTMRIQTSMIVAQERSRILEQISANTHSSKVLPEICDAVKRLFPNLDCSFVLKEGQHTKTGALAHEVGEQIRVPLTDPSGREVGEIVVAPRNNVRLTAEQLEYVTSLTELSTMAVRQALLYDGLVHHSTHDPLTNLPNRRLCETRLALAIDQAAKDGKRIAVIYVDVNRFKQVNDQFGHKVGDSYLKLISQRFLAETRPCDTVARIGGDEFLLIVPVGEEAEGAEEIVARLRSCFDSPFHCDEVRIDGSASFGAAVYPYDGTTADDLKRNADYAMYVAKKTESDNARQAESAAVIGVEG